MAKKVKAGWATKAGKNKLKLSRVKENITREKRLAMLEEMITNLVAGKTAEADIKLHEYLTSKARGIINEKEDDSDEDDMMDDEKEGDDEDDSEPDNDGDDSEDDSDEDDMDDKDEDDSEEDDSDDSEEDDSDEDDDMEPPTKKVTEAMKLKAKNLRNAAAIKKRTKGK
jgi:hypothetical protein